MPSFWKNFNLGFLNSLAGHDGYVALDIGSSSVKMVEAAVDKSGYRILNLGILPLPVNAIQNNMVVDSKPVVETIRKLVETSGVRSKQVISAVPGRAVIMKKVQMPKQEPAELEANIEFEAQHLHVGVEAAEAFKMTGLLEGKKGLDLTATLRPPSEELAEEIRRTVSLYGAVPSEEGDGLKTIYLSGGGAKLAGLRVLLEERMGVPVKLSEPFRGFNVNKNIDRDYLVESAPYFAVGAGLSIRRPADK